MAQVSEPTKPYVSEGVRGTVSFSTAWSHNMETHSRSFHVTAEEPVSGQVLIDVQLGPQDLADFIAGSSVHVEARRVVPHPERLGRRSHVRTVAVRNGGDDRSVDEAAGDVREKLEAEGWTVTVGRTNYGRSVTARRWVEDEEATP